MVGSFESVTGRPINKQFAPRRHGDVAQCYANPNKAHKALAWHASRSLDEMCQSTWNFQLKEGRGSEL
jgi:UDP-glucose 4-epimerase